MFPKLYPHLKQLLSYDQTSKGPFAQGKPTGVTVHYTADRDIPRSVASLVKLNLGYHLLIDRNGDVIQMIPFDKKCWHAGNAVWAGQSPNQSHVAVALASWGHLEQPKPGVFHSWAKVLVPKADVAQRADNIRGLVQPWDIATDAQITSLFDILRWLIDQGISPSNICGHDECALPPGRKTDPGGVLPMSMAQVRKSLAGVFPNV